MKETTAEAEQSFEYTYSARKQAEIEYIRKKYLPKEADTLEELRALDRSVERPGTIWSIVLGIVGTLIMGTGMSCCMVGPQILELIEKLAK